MRRVTRLLGIVSGLAVMAVAIERLVFATPRWDGPSSDHFDGKRFHNVHPGWQSEGSFLKWRLTRKAEPWPRWVDRPPGPPPPTRVDGGRLRVTFVNHSTLLVQIDGVNILTDPIWSQRCSPVTFAGPRRHRPPGIRFEDLPPIDAVIVSHNHYDHLDVATLRRLTGATIVTPIGNAALMAKHGIPGARELDWWQETTIAHGIRIVAVPAQHFSARSLSDRDVNLWGGFVIVAPSGNIFFAGDTGWGDHFAHVGLRFGPIRLAMLPIGAYLPRWFMKPAHISPAEAVRAHVELGAGTSVAMHYGTFALGDDGMDQPVIDLRRTLEERRETRFLVLIEGVGREIE